MIQKTTSERRNKQDALKGTQDLSENETMNECAFLPSYAD